MAENDSCQKLVVSQEKSINLLLNQTSLLRLSLSKKDSVNDQLRLALGKADDALKLEQDICKKKVGKLRFQKWAGIGSGILFGYVLAKAIK